MRKKTITIILIMLFLLLLMTGCGGSPTGNETDETRGQEPGETVNRLDQLKSAYKNEGFDVGENKVIAFEMLYADKGMKFEIDGELIEIYEYDMSNLSDEANDIVEQAKSGSINFSGFNVPVKFKNGLMLVRYDEHSKGEEIVKVFENFK